MAQHLPLEGALAWHLQHNHYPPVPLSMVGPCRDAIIAIDDEDDPGREITLPEGVTYRGQPTAPAYAIAEQHHLSAFYGGDTCPED